MVVADYVTKFEELSKFCPYYIGVDVKGFKCVKFGSGWHPEILNNLLDIRRLFISQCWSTSAIFMMRTI